MNINYLINNYLMPLMLFVMAIITAMFLFVTILMMSEIGAPLELTRENLDLIVFAFKVQTILTAIFAFLFSAQFIYRELPGASWRDKMKLVRL